MRVEIVGTAITVLETWLLVAAGFALVTLGALLAGPVDRVLPLSRSVALVVENGFAACGFTVVLYSLVRE